jgi:hypothetical protein
LVTTSTLVNGVSLKRRIEALARIVAAREPKKLPVVLSVDEIVQIVATLTGLPVHRPGSGERPGRAARQ